MLLELMKEYDKLVQKECGMPTLARTECVSLAGSIIRETDRAVLLRFDHHGETKEEWFPLSQIESIRRSDTEDSIFVSRWVYSKKGLE